MWKKIVLIIAVLLLLTGLGFLLFPPVSNMIGKQVSKGQTDTFDQKLEKVITEDDDAGTGITAKSYAKAVEKKEIDKQGYPIDKDGNRTASLPVLFKEDLDRLLRDTVAYNDDLKKSQSSKFTDGAVDYPALDLTNYGIFDNIFAYISAPSIDMVLPVYLGTSELNMSYGAAHMTYTSLPLGGLNTNAVVAGHSGYVGRIFFDNITHLPVGERVYIHTFWGTLTYEVFEMRIGRPDQADCIYIRKGEDIVTMFTCTPLDGEFGRYYVVCKRV